VREHRAGRLAEAAAAYRKILVIRPDVAGVCNNLGNLLMAEGKVEEAAAQYERAVALQPDFFQVYNNLGCILSGQGKLDQALARFEQALALRPDYAEAHYNLGNVLLGQGKLDEAAARYEQAIALRPDYAEAHNNLASVLLSQDKLDEALQRFEQVVALRPDYAEAHNNLGNILAQQGKLVEAAARYEQALALSPDHAEAHHSLGKVFWKQGKPDEAAARFEQALALRPDYAEAHYNLGVVLKHQGQLDQAAAHYEQAVALQPDYADAHYNLGLALREQGKLDQAAARYQQAIALRPDHAEAHNNLANVLTEQARFDEAAAGYEQALALQPDFAEAQLGRATCYLLHGDYERGWPEYEARLRMAGFALPLGIPRWTGEPLAGRSLLLVAEQGLGDTLQFIRYARPLKELGARVVLACPKALGRLLASHAALDELFVLGSAEELPRSDFYLPLLSAPGMFGTTASTIPCNIPYLAADPELTDAWGRELARIDGFKIGIVWQGWRDYRFDRWRSIPLAQFAPLASLPGVRLVSLQKGFGSEQVAAVDFPILDLSDRLDETTGPFMDTAAVIRGLDLVVTPDTAITHLAGALGVPVWVALHRSPYWIWQLDRDDSPWYPTARLFRQTTFNHWPDVFQRIADAVEALHK
jgi:Tfp pilus assembly protein PilF